MEKYVVEPPSIIPSTKSNNKPKENYGVLFEWNENKTKSFTSNLFAKWKYLLLIIWVYLIIDLHKMTSVEDPNEQKFHFWVFCSRPKRSLEKFPMCWERRIFEIYLEKKNIRTDNL